MADCDVLLDVLHPRSFDADTALQYSSFLGEYMPPTFQELLPGELGLVISSDRLGAYMTLQEGVGSRFSRRTRTLPTVFPPL